MKFKVYRTKTFDKGFDRLPFAEQEMIKKFEKKLVDAPYLGRPLGYVFFREKKLNSRRIYFLIYEDVVIILMVAISDKKAQQVTIDAIKSKLNEYSAYIKRELKKHI